MTREVQAMDTSLGDTIAPAGSIVIDVGAIGQWFTGHETAASAPWADRWLWLFAVPLLVGLIVSALVLHRAREEGPRLTARATTRQLHSGALKQDPDTSADLAAKLTFLGAAVVAAAQLDIFKTGKVVDGSDLGILFVVNIVFTAIAASHNLLADLPALKEKDPSGDLGGRLTRGVLILSAVGSLTSVLVVVWRTPSEVVPGLVKLMFTLLIIVAAVMVCTYVRVRLPGKPMTEARPEDAAGERQALVSPPKPPTPSLTRNGSVQSHRLASNGLVFRISGHINLKRPKHPSTP